MCRYRKNTQKKKEDLKMKIQTINVGLSKFERETTINIVFENESDTVKDRKVIIDTTVLSDYNALKSRGWKQTDEYRYENGTVCGGAFEGSIRDITFRRVGGKKLTEDRRKALANNFDGHKDESVEPDVDD